MLRQYSSERKLSFNFGIFYLNNFFTFFYVTIIFYISSEFAEICKNLENLSSVIF